MTRIDAAGVQQPLTELANSRLEKLEVFSTIASTNTYLMSQPPPAAGSFRVAIADHQTSGRGRHYRRWISRPGAGLCLSVAYTFGKPGGRLDGLTLAIGVGVIGALRQLGIADVRLKWPNDIVALDGKLGGILTEVQSGRRAATTVVTGIGLNIDVGKRLDFGAECGWARHPVDLRQLVSILPPRERIAGTIVDHLYLTFCHFEESGLAGFMDDWRRHDWLRGREITVELPDRNLTGVAAGVAEDGTLLVDSGGERVPVISGSILAAGPRASAP